MLKNWPVLVLIVSALLSYIKITLQLYNLEAYQQLKKKSPTQQVVTFVKNSRLTRSNA